MVLCINANSKNSLVLHPVVAKLLTESPLDHVDYHRVKKKNEEKNTRKNAYTYGN